MRTALKTLLGVMGLALAASAAAQVTLYEREGFHGRSLTADNPIPNLDSTGFNDRASSAIVNTGRWEVCEDPYFRGRCVVLRPGDYWSLDRMGMNRRISSVMPQNLPGDYEAPPVAYEHGRSPGERAYEVPVTLVHAVADERPSGSAHRRER